MINEFKHKDKQAHFQLSNDEFEKQFTDCELDPELFSHEAHLRLAWIHIQKYGVDNAIENVSIQLKRYTAHVNAADKFNKTVTIAAVYAVRHFMQKTPSTNFFSFMRTDPQLKHQFKSLIQSHYSATIFTLPAAKNEFLQPDLSPFI
jgi:hypothetical protein